MSVQAEIRRALSEISEIETKISVLKGRLAERQSALRKLRAQEAMTSRAAQPATAMAS